MSNQFKSIFIFIVLVTSSQQCFATAPSSAKSQRELVIETVDTQLGGFYNKIYFPVRGVASFSGKDITRCRSGGVLWTTTQEVHDARVAVFKKCVPECLSEALDAIKAGVLGSSYAFVVEMLNYFEETVVVPIERMTPQLLVLRNDALMEELYVLCDELLLRFAANIYAVANLLILEEQVSIGEYVSIHVPRLRQRLQMALRLSALEDSFDEQFGRLSVSIVSPNSSLSSPQSYVSPPSSPSVSKGTPKNVSFMNQVIVIEPWQEPQPAVVSPSSLVRLPARAMLDPNAPGALYYIWRCARLAEEALEVSREVFAVLTQPKECFAMVENVCFMGIHLSE